MPDILAIITIFCSAFLGATIAVGYFYGLSALGEWREGRNSPAAGDDSPTTDNGVYDWKDDDGVTWRR